MLKPLLFVFILVLFGTMNFLLWRSEISGRNQLGGAIPVETVWHKITTAPDDSALEIRYRDKKVGYCRWSPNIGSEVATGKRIEEELPPEGMIQSVTGYSLDFDGNFDVLTNRVRFNMHATLSTNHQWQQFQIRLHRRPDVLVVRADQAAQEIQFSLENGRESIEHKIPFAQARDPQRLLRQFGGPFLPGLLTGLGVPLDLGGTTREFALGIQWEAHHNWMMIGHSRLRVYRLHTRLFDQSEITILVSRVGEILRVELPQKITLVNEALLNL